MTQEDKELLLKDLCARLPYDIKCKIEMWIGYDVCTIYNINSIGFVEIVEDSDTNGVNIERIKPYLFPLSSMTEEQKREYYSLKHEVPVCHYEYGDVVEEFELYDSPESFEYLIENHFDYRGLIPKGIALDATGLNIY